MKKQNLYRLTAAGMLIALEVILAFTPLGYLKIGLLSITFMTIPVIIGSLTTGATVATILGFTFGITSFVQCFGMDAFGTTLTSTLCMQSDLYRDMADKGWYPPEQAPRQKMDAVKQKFSAVC